MTLGDLTLPISYAEASQYALLFTPQLAGRLAELHAQYGRPDCVPMPRTLVDGRLMLPATLLTAIEGDGWLAGMWAAADKEVLNASVEVLPWADAVALLPPDPPMGE
jgi:hypothetical protein